jgi:hypothetical protein
VKKYITEMMKQRRQQKPKDVKIPYEIPYLEKWVIAQIE